MNEKRFEKDFDENVCSFDYSTLDTYYEYNVSNEEIIEWNKHSSNAQYRNLKHIAEILNIKQMQLESLMEHREEIGKLLDRIEEQQVIIDRLQRYNDVLHDENLFNTMKMFEFMKEKEVFDEFYENLKSRLLLSLSKEKRISS